MTITFILFAYNRINDDAEYDEVDTYEDVLKVELTKDSDVIVTFKDNSRMVYGFREYNTFTIEEEA